METPNNLSCLVWFGIFFPPHLNSHRVWTGCPKGVGFFQNQIFSFEKVFSTQYGLMLHSSSGLNNRAREGRDQCGRVVPWLPDQEIPPVQHKCVPPPTHTPPTHTYIHCTHTHTQHSPHKELEHPGRKSSMEERCYICVSEVLPDQP